MNIEHSVHILLVDDRPENLLALESILVTMGHNLVRAHSGEEALRSLLKQDFAVILLDVQMPGIDGFETATLIRARGRSQHTPIIFLTALDSSDTNVFKGYSVGAVDFMFKPFMPDVLRFKVSVFVELFKQTAQIQQHAANLEARVQERTADLTIANDSLRDEIRERERAEQALRLLTDASSVLAASLDYDNTLHNIVQFIVPHFADLCVIDMIPAEVEPRRVVLAHRDQAQETTIHQMINAALPNGWNSSDPLIQGLQRGETQFIPRISSERIAAYVEHDEQAALLQALGFRSAICLPIQMDDCTIGIMALLYSTSGRQYVEADVLLATELSRRVSLAIEHALLYRAKQQALSARDQFLSIASHELKTPITTILGYAQLLERRFARLPDIEPRNLNALHTLSDQCQRLDRLIRSLLDLSRIQTGQFTLDTLPMDLTRLTRQIVDEIQPSISEHVVSLTSEEQPLLIHGDELRLAQVIHNLVQNAIKYSPNGGTIEVSVRAKDSMVELLVHDQGLGIPAESLPQLFNRFFRASNVEPQVAGLGLGLYVVKQIVELHTGTIEVQSVEGVGSTFIVRIPSSPESALAVGAATLDASHSAQ